MKRCVRVLALLWVGALAACDADSRPTVTVTDSVAFSDNSLGRITTQIESGSECTPPGARTEVDVSEHVLETYVGAYELAPGMTIVVTLEDGTLFAQPRGKQKAGLFAEKVR